MNERPEQDLKPQEKKRGKYYLIKPQVRPNYPTKQHSKKYFKKQKKKKESYIWDYHPE